MFTICKKSVFIDGKQETVYGVQSKELTVDDVSPDLKSVEQLVTLLNSGDVSAEHFLDVVEDFIFLN